MEKKKICFVVAVYRTAQSFLRDHFSYLIKDYEIHLVANFPSDKEKIFFQEIGLICHDVPIQRNIKVLGDIKSLCKLTNIFKKEKFDCVHSVTQKAGLLTAMAGKLARVPNRVHIYTGQVWATRKGAMRLFLKQNCRK